MPLLCLAAPPRAAAAGRVSLRPAQDFTPRIVLSEEDFAVMTRGGALLDPGGQLLLADFEAIMRDQVRQFVLRQLTGALTAAAGGGGPPRGVPAEVVQLSTAKAILHQQV